MNHLSITVYHRLTSTNLINKPWPIVREWKHLFHREKLSHSAFSLFKCLIKRKQVHIRVQKYYKTIGILMSWIRSVESSTKLSTIVLRKAVSAILCSLNEEILSSSDITDAYSRIYPNLFRAATVGVFRPNSHFTLSSHLNHARSCQ